jgi:DNA-binding transcriptional LysR family regulator
MNSSRLQSFLAVAETLSFSKADDDLYKNQSVLSRQISNLEEEIGLILFNRSPHCVSLTPAGEIFAGGIRFWL